MIRGQIISYTAQANKRHSGRLPELSNLILELDRRYASSSSPDLFKQRLVLQTEFNLLSTQQAEQLLSKSHHAVYENGLATLRPLV